MDRRPPVIKNIRNISVPSPQKYHLSNGLPVYVMHMGTQDIVKAELVFYAGRPFESKKMAARATARILKEGTQNFTGAEIAETIDFYGGSIGVPVSLDTININLYGLGKHIQKLLPVFSEIVCAPSFPQEEIDALVKNSIQRLKVDLSKTDVTAYREVTERIFGDDHPYGYNSNEELYHDIQREDLVQHHKKHFNSNNGFLLLSGNITEEVLGWVEEHLGKLPKGEHSVKKELLANNTLPHPVHVERPNSVQTAIRIGRHLFNKSHADFGSMYVLNTILGGYFGSRLMENIREEKGFTYNIFSSLDTMAYDGYFYIGTEVSHHLTADTIKEIHHEIHKLQTELISDKELKMVKNYILGNMLTILDGPMNIMNVIKDSILNDFPLDHFNQFVQDIQNTTPEQLQNLAKTYLNPKDFWQITVGKKVEK